MSDIDKKNNFIYQKNNDWEKYRNGIYLPYNPPRNPSLNNYNDTHNNIIL